MDLIFFYVLGKPKNGLVGSFALQGLESLQIRLQYALFECPGGLHSIKKTLPEMSCMNRA